MQTVWQIYARGDLLTKQYFNTLEEYDEKDESKKVADKIVQVSKEWQKESWWTLPESVQEKINDWVCEGRKRFEFMNSAELDDEDKAFIEEHDGQRDAGNLGSRRLIEQDFYDVEFQGAFCKMGIDMSPSHIENGVPSGTIWSDRRCGETALVHCPMRQVLFSDASNVVHPVFNHVSV